MQTDLPEIATSGSHMYIIWTDGTTNNSSIYFKADNGNSVGNTINLSEHTLGSN